MKIPKDSFQFEITEKEGQRGFKLNSPTYLQHFLKTKVKVGDRGTMHLDFKKPTRSENQLDYYFVLCTLIAAHTGDTKDDMHVILTSLKFGTRKVKRFGEEVTLRQSVSNAAKIPKDRMGELIEFALEKAAYLEIKVPTKEELGYISN